MLANTPYSLYAQTKTGTKVTNGSTVSFKTGALPDTVPFPKFTVKIPASGPRRTPAIR